MRISCLDTSSCEAAQSLVAAWQRQLFLRDRPSKQKALIRHLQLLLGAQLRGGCRCAALCMGPGGRHARGDDGRPAEAGRAAPAWPRACAAPRPGCACPAAVTMKMSITLTLKFALHWCSFVLHISLSAVRTCSLASTRVASSLSHAAVLTAMTPSSVSVLIASSGASTAITPAQTAAQISSGCSKNKLRKKNREPICA